MTKIRKIKHERNFVAKYARKFNRAQVEENAKHKLTNRPIKHKLKEINGELE